MRENHYWLQDVLADLEAYAKKNEFTELSQKIGKTREIAASEIAARVAERSAASAHFE